MVTFMYQVGLAFRYFTCISACQFSYLIVLLIVAFVACPLF